ncbi:MAG TPA: Spy/CpxP family protein refolding chaperone [Stellaceae bacterium]|nr:Spy/CpxP family protein refolding chaperone [Stellaceae bacterium]
MAVFSSARGMASVASTMAMAAFLMAGAAAPGIAQTATHERPAAAKAATSMKPETVDQRITQLHTDLKITPQQEQDWKAVADAIRSNADDMKNLVEQTRQESPKDERNALQDLQTYQKFAQAHADGLQKLTAAFGTLYGAMSPEQKANADRVFRSFEHRRHGGGHERG